MFFGSRFFIISMIFDKVIMIFSRYGGLLLMLFISFVFSSYIHFVIKFSFHELIKYNLFNRPELVVKYFWGYLRDYYTNRAGLPLSATIKVILILALPFIFLKLIRVGLQFLLFYLAMKIQYKFPTVSKFILRRTVFANTILGANYDKKKNQTAVKPVNPNPVNSATINSHVINSQSQNNDVEKTPPKVNLRK